MALLTFGLALAGCSSSSSSSPRPSGHTGSSAPQPQPSSGSAASSSSAPTSSGAEPTSGSGATTAIEANWAKFFNSKTPTATRLALLQDGQTFATIIKSQEGSTLAGAASSKVTHVTLTGTTQASVTYKILVAGQSVLSNRSGVAVYQDGVWKVGIASFCDLLKLENGGGTKGLPSACQG